MPQFRPYGRAKAVCPYYLLDSRKSVSCVCADELAESAVMIFGSEEEKRCFMKEHCFLRNGGECDRAALLRKKHL